MRNDPNYRRRFLSALAVATENRRVPWDDNRPDEPSLAAYFPDGKVHLILPEEGNPHPEVIVYGRWLETLGRFQPEGIEEPALFERLRRLAEQNKLGEDETISSWPDGRIIRLQEIFRDIDSEVGEQAANSEGGRRRGRFPSGKPA